ncbi:MAG: DegT/DnrJ/EryC1/StrS family aminotransferase [Ginsengibacter sp.]
MKIPFSSFEQINKLIKPEILSAFESFFDRSWYILGEDVKKFEKEYASFNNVSDCVGVSNGLDALHLALKCLNIGPGDEVIVPSNTYIATWLAVSYVGALPVPVEPDIRTCNIDVSRIEAAITRKTKSIMPVHLYGHACDMETIMTIARKHGLHVIEDNAQAQGATFNNRLTGSFGDINATSFYPGKNLGALGDAGAITTNNPLLAEKGRILRNYGSQKKYCHEVIGYNMRLDECQASFLSVKLKYLDRWSKQRLDIAGKYSRLLKGVGDLLLPFVSPGATHVYHLYVVRTDKRDALQRYLTEQGIGTLIHYPVPPHLQKAYQSLGYNSGDLPVAEEIANTCLSLPMWPGMEEEQVLQVASSIKAFYQLPQ